jgi:hypothetical protein
MPAMRREVLQALQQSNGWLNRAELMDVTDIPRTPIERELEDLVLVGLADRQKTGDANKTPGSTSCPRKPTDCGRKLPRNVRPPFR